MELKIKNSVFHCFFSYASAGCALTYLIIIILDYNYFIFHAIPFHRSSKTKVYFRKDVSESCTLNTNGQKSHVSFKNSM